MIPGNGGPTVNHLRLWSGRAITPFHIDAFNAGDYAAAVQEQVEAKNLSRVLYPDDSTPQGKELRLKQQYFFVSASLQDILATHLSEGRSLASLPDSIAIQLNDTHPAVAIPELMRLLVDEHGLSWAESWQITQGVFSYTNHTLLPEALETWPVAMFERLLPRHLQIIYLINRDFLQSVEARATQAMQSVCGSCRSSTMAAIAACAWRISPSSAATESTASRSCTRISCASTCFADFARDVSGAVHQCDQRDRSAPLAEAVESRAVGAAHASIWAEPGKMISRSSAA